MGREGEQRIKILHNELFDWFKALKKQKPEMELRILSSERRGFEYHDEDARVDSRGS